MNGRKVLVATAVAALTVNAVVVVDALSFGGLASQAEAKGSDGERARPGERGKAAATAAAGAPGAGPATGPAEAGASEAEAAYRTLVEGLQQQKQALDRRADELSERERQFQVLKQSLASDAAALPAGAAQGGVAAGGAAAAAAPHAAFDRLLKAYEGMDPENAAAALAELYNKDQQVVVDVLLGMKPRQAAAVLDAIAATAPSIAAELSLEVWKRDR